MTAPGGAASPQHGSRSPVSSSCGARPQAYSVAPGGDWRADTALSGALVDEAGGDARAPPPTSVRFRGGLATAHSWGKARGWAGAAEGTASAGGMGEDRAGKHVSGSWAGGTVSTGLRGTSEKPPAFRSGVQRDKCGGRRDPDESADRSQSPLGTAEKKQGSQWTRSSSSPPLTRATYPRPRCWGGQRPPRVWRALVWWVPRAAGLRVFGPPVAEGCGAGRLNPSYSPCYTGKSQRRGASSAGMGCSSLGRRCGDLPALAPPPRIRGDNHLAARVRLAVVHIQSKRLQGTSLDKCIPGQGEVRQRVRAMVFFTDRRASRIDLQVFTVI